MLTVVCFSQWIEFIREGQTGKMAQHFLDTEKTHGPFQTLGTILTASSLYGMIEDSDDLA